MTLAGGQWQLYDFWIAPIGMREPLSRGQC